MKIDNILNSFPKERPLISDELKNIYEDQYKKIEMEQALDRF